MNNTKGQCEWGTYVSVWLPLIHTALMISGISGEAQMPRPNRLEVTPLHAQANRSQTKAQLAALGSVMEPCGFVEVLCMPGNHTLASNNIQLCRHLSKHVYEEPARRGFSTPLKLVSLQENCVS